MNCKDFKDLADSYLSNELLVETNHDILRHLEACRDCREMLASHREVRERLKSSVTKAELSRIEPAVSERIIEHLRASAGRSTGFAQLLHLGILGAGAVVLIGTFVFFTYRGGGNEAEIRADNRLPENVIIAPPGTEFLRAVLKEAAADAVDDHKNCALSHNLKERPISLEKAARTVDVVNLGIDRKVLDALREKFGSDAVLIKAHYCVINGRYFTHVVVSLRKRIFSLLLTKLSDPEANSFEPAACGRSGDLSSACYSVNGYGIFIVSDALESDNLIVANTLAEALTRHIARVRLSI